MTKKNALFLVTHIFWAKSRQNMREKEREKTDEEEKTNIVRAWNADNISVDRKCYSKFYGVFVCPFSIHPFISVARICTSVICIWDKVPSGLRLNHTFQLNQCGTTDGVIVNCSKLQFSRFCFFCFACDFVVDDDQKPFLHKSSHIPLHLIKPEMGNGVDSERTDNHILYILIHAFAPFGFCSFAYAISSRWWQWPMDISKGHNFKPYCRYVCVRLGYCMVEPHPNRWQYRIMQYHHLGIRVTISFLCVLHLAYRHHPLMREESNIFVPHQIALIS